MTMKQIISLFLFWALLSLQSFAEEFKVTVRSQTPQSNAVNPVFQYEVQNWKLEETAVIICDMWDTGKDEANELALNINKFADAARQKGAVIIHAPAGVMGYYADNPARLRAITYGVGCGNAVGDAQYLGTYVEKPGAGGANTVPGISDRIMQNPHHWFKTPAELLEPWPIFRVRGDYPTGDPEAGDRPFNPGALNAPSWFRQVSCIKIDPDKDFISDNGIEIASILVRNGIKNVAMTGVATDMCVLGRPYGLRNLKKLGVNAVLVRDLTEASNGSETEKVAQFIERRVAPTMLFEDLKK
jgi:nicotinamidase-related amidase